MIKNFYEFGLDIIVASVLEWQSKNGVKTVDQRSPPVKTFKIPIVKIFRQAVDRQILTI